MKKLTIILFLTLCSFTNCQDIELKITTEWIIGDDLSKSKEYIFYYPEMIRTDNTGQVYIKDKNNQFIKKYSKDGKFICNIGRLGRGPGEFQDLSSFVITEKNELFCIDKGNKKILLFNNSGKNYKIINLPKRDFMEVTDILLLQNNDLCFFDKANSRLNSDLFFIYDGNNLQQKESFCKPSDFWNQDDAFQKQLNIMAPLKICEIDKIRFAVTSQIYDGNIYIYEKGDNKWLRKKLIGFSPPKGAYKIISKNEFDNSRNKGNTLIAFNDGGNRIVYTQVLSHSLGLFLYQEKYLVNFIKFTKGTSNIFGLDIYTTNGKYIGFKLIEEINNTDENKTIPRILWKDHYNYFYLNELINGIPIIKKIRFELSVNGI